MRTKDFILLGAGYAAGRLSKKINAGPIGAVGNDDKLRVYNSLEKGDRIKIKYEALKGLSKMKSDLIKIQRDLDAHTDNKIKTNKIKSAIDSTWKEVTRKLDSLM